MTQLLVSVRSAAEAATALAGGAHLIDVKEPARGALGAADPAVIAAVIDRVGGKRPVSAALGELDPTGATRLPIAGLAYAKWGFAGWANRASCWGQAFRETIRTARAAGPQCQPVLAAYADWQRANAPSVAEVAALARELRAPLLIDTWSKDGSHLLDWLPMAELAALRATCRDAKTPLALAGSLRHEQIRKLLPLHPDWFAVRGAACSEGNRAAAIDGDRVHALVELIDSVDAS